MLRSAVTTVCRLRGCLPQLQHSIDNGVGVGMGVSRRWLQVTGVARVLDRDHQAKKAKDNTRLDDLTSVPDEDDDESHSINFSSMFPSVETHSMLINNTRFDELPTIHVKATHNNTIIMVTDGKGVPLAHESGGTVGFRNSRKGTNIAAQAAAIALAQKATKKGINLVRVSVKGIGPGRLPAIKGLQMSGLTVVSITDATPLPHNGHRPKKQRRV